MKIFYVTTDLEFASGADLSPIVTELEAKDLIVHLSDWVGDVYRVALGVGRRDSHPEDALSFYCSLIETLSDSSRVLWNECARRVLDIAFESGTEPECETYRLDEPLVRRAASLGMSIAVTIYRVGAYSTPKGDK